jgi:hypothetical protein
MKKDISFQPWRHYFNDVENQGNANSCYISAACSVLEATWHFQTKESIILSKQDLYNHLVRDKEE